MNQWKAFCLPENQRKCIDHLKKKWVQGASEREGGREDAGKLFTNNQVRENLPNTQHKVHSYLMLRTL